MLNCIIMTRIDSARAPWRCRSLESFELVGLQVATDAVEIALHQAEHAGVRVLDAAELDLVDELRPPALEVVGKRSATKPMAGSNCVIL